MVVVGGEWAHQDLNLESTGYEPVALTVMLYALIKTFVRGDNSIAIILYSRKKNTDYKI